MEIIQKISLRKCCYCGCDFWVDKRSEKIYCSSECSKLGKSEKLKKAYKGYDPVIARASRTKESFEKQSKAMKLRWKSKNHVGWFQNLPDDSKTFLKQKFSELAQRNVNKYHTFKTGSIQKYGLRFDSKVELFVYENFKDRNIFLERNVSHNGWLVDFNIPSIGKFLELKSWYTVLNLQGLNDVKSKLDDSIFLLEEDDAYYLKNVSTENIWKYIDEKSSYFKNQLVAL